MQHKEILNLVYSPTTLCLMVGEDRPESLSQSTITHGQEARSSLNLLSEITAKPRNQKTVIATLEKLKTLLQGGVPLHFRPELFKDMNRVLGILSKQYPREKIVFKAAFETITALKEQIDKTQQAAPSLCEMEWVELEKAVYLLCDWEDGLEASLG